MNIKQFFMIFAPLVLIGSVIAVVLIFSGPRMRDQQAVNTYEREMPLPPPLSVPVQGNMPMAPTPDEQASFTLPPATEANLARGEVLYSYYCVFCHGEDGKGNGPVGKSYLPIPTDLGSPQVTGKSNGELLKAMLTGNGHEPVLSRIVLSEYRPTLALYVRHLGEKSSPKNTSGEAGEAVASASEETSGLSGE